MNTTKEQKASTGRTIGLLGATGVGVGAIVGGGVLALAGTAFTATGPSAMLAFLLNGLIAVVTALSYAEMSAAFPESGGAYVFSKKILSVPAAFLAGWVVWFASVVACVLYALGFASYAANAAVSLGGRLPVHGFGPAATKGVVILLAATATGAYAVSLIRKGSGGGLWATWGKVVVFGVIILTGIWYLCESSGADLAAGLTPFFPKGSAGLLQAMGYTFIALQGFDLIAAVAGEVKAPEKNIPRAMLLSLGIALAIYLPLLLVITTVGVRPDQNIVGMSLKNPETVIAVAVSNYLGPFGYWLVMAGALLAMLSALQANLLAASRVAHSMAADRALPRVLSTVSHRFGTPAPAITVTAVMVAVIILIFGDVAAAGAAASLIFLVSFALTQWTAILARVRVGPGAFPFRTPWFPGVQIAGIVACLALAVFQGIQVPRAGLIVLLWLACGGVLYLALFARRAQIVDAAAAALDPRLLQLRGRSPLVLVPIANPANAESMVEVANALAPPTIGRVLLLSVVTPPENWQRGETPWQLGVSQNVIRQALTASFVAGLAPEALTTVAPRPWQEIVRVARMHRCESLLLGLSDLVQTATLTRLEEMMSQIDANVVVLRAPAGWHLGAATKVLVPLGGRGQHDQLRARLLSRLCQHTIRTVTFLQILPEQATDKAVRKASRWLQQLARDEMSCEAVIDVIRSNRVEEHIIKRATDTDLIILGLQRFGRHQKLFGEKVLGIARNTDCGLIMINCKG